MAFSLATSPEKLKAIRERLAGNRTEFPLFDTALFARRLETAFRVMLARHRDGLAPDHLMIDA
jgi:predicted O-linked N-acetylglucosamine transferase (SPINDLY family)